MNKVLLILLFTTSLYSQKLWEIEVDPSDYLRDVVEIPNSDLLLFTYNTGKLEIRNSQDGSFVNQLIKKPNESGELRISSNGQLYHYQHIADTMEFRDIITNETIFRISPEIEGLEGNPIFDRKYFNRIEIFDNNSKIVGSISYIDNEDSRNSTYRFVVYNILTKEVEYKSMPYEGRYEAIKKTYKSPDDKYFIEFALYYPRARMFNLETREYEFEFDGERIEDDKIKIEVLEKANFQSGSSIVRASGNIFQIYLFPQFNLLTDIDVWSRSNFIMSSINSLKICENKFVSRISERKENQQTKYYRYFLKYNYETGEIIFNSREYQTNLDYCYVFTVDNCNKLIIDRDYDYRAGIIACYDYNTLEIEKEFESNIFPNPTSDIINIDTNTPTNIELFDIFGNKQLEDYNTKLDISHLSPGTYYIRYLGQTKMVVKI